MSRSGDLRLALRALRWFWRHKAVLPLVVLLAGAAWWWDRHQQESMSLAGVPKAQTWSLTHWTRVFRNEGFLVGYSEWRADPLWVAYRLSPITQRKHLRRPQHFNIDGRSLRRVSHQDYSRSGYDRGHLAPNYAISNLYGRAGQLDSFLMSNVVPQRANLNQKLWQRLEEVEADYFTRRYKKLWVYAGPVFDDKREFLRSGVEIPDAFFKIYAVPDEQGRWPKKLLAFVMPQKVRGNERLDKYLVSVDEVERLTGLDFFPDLPLALAKRLESRQDSSGWNLKKLAGLPGRYTKSRKARP